MKKTGKHVLLSVLVSVLTVLLFSGLSYGITRAYLTATDQAENILTVGETVGKTEEEFPDPSPEPGETSKKQAAIRNTGNLPAFVRVKLIYSDSMAQALTAVTGIDSSVWKYDPETDYYYYTKLVAPGEATADFMEGVTFLTESGDYAYEDLTEFDLSIYAELYQHYDHEGACTGTEYRDSWNRIGNGA